MATSGCAQAPPVPGLAQRCRGGGSSVVGVREGATGVEGHRVEESRPLPYNTTAPPPLISLVLHGSHEVGWGRGPRIRGCWALPVGEDARVEEEDAEVGEGTC
jgi:hypothetical protein